MSEVSASSMAQQPWTFPKVFPSYSCYSTKNTSFLEVAAEITYHSCRSSVADLKLSGPARMDILIPRVWASSRSVQSPEYPCHPNHSCKCGAV
ncbi:hypothetical protein TNCV_454591 [Trichonephila clavipes]|nr:hypothetical protein TNCV_454591 [Trichonephila clavipes]